MYIEIDFSSDEAYYQQLCNQIIQGIATSQFSDGDVLPSVRELAEEIGINMHTVNKAYSVLKQEGFVKVDRRKGAVVSVDSNKQHALDMIRKEMQPLLAESYCRNLSREDIKGMVDEIYDAYEGCEDERK
ncbi:DNA-binding transcriptional regulator YhcF, GntR family [Lachnospiraceae bacterium NK3A20]|jgi:GntR family transcriptional regulator|nr:DNA-binding transcriptional regulator YhcF, GntR family [Lachnospiraceae bacterium NK3A20]